MSPKIADLLITDFNYPGKVLELARAEALELARGYDSTGNGFGWGEDDERCRGTIGGMTYDFRTLTKAAQECSSVWVSAHTAEGFRAVSARIQIID